MNKKSPLVHHNPLFFFLLKKNHSINPLSFLVKKKSFNQSIKNKVHQIHPLLYFNGWIIHPIHIFLNYFLIKTKLT